MLGRFKNALYSAMGGVDVEGVTVAGDQRVPSGGPRPLSKPDSPQGHGAQGGSGVHRVKYGYQRPIFLQLFTDDEIQVTADHLVRPIMVPRDIHILPWFTGYAEAINAGKSLRNEDQAVFHRGVLRTRDAESPLSESEVSWEIPYIYFGTFDGHAGAGCAVAAANELHQVVHKKLMAILSHLVPGNRGQTGGGGVIWFPNRDISTESLIVGALESAFWDMDASIGEDKKRYKMQGGCTALVSLFILGKLYVANAGDSRAVLCRKGSAYPMSNDFTPVSERQRLQLLGYHKPHLLGNEYTRLDFSRRPMRKDVGTLMLYRDAHMTGWTYKEIGPEDLKFPMVYGEGKRSRLLATIGVTRGFGDHDLRAQSQNGPIYIKPFLSPQPEVRVLDIENENIGESDVLVMATDGLWDVVTNERVAEVVEAGLQLYEGSSEETRLKYRFISIAQDLVMAARGKLVERSWKRGDGSAATIDDISAFAIPILPYKEEFAAWVAARAAQQQQQQTSIPVVAGEGGPSQSEALSNGGSSEKSLTGGASVEDVKMDVEDIAEEAVEQDPDVVDDDDDEDEAQK